MGITFAVCFVTDAMVSFSEQLGTGVCSCETTPTKETLQIDHKVRYVKDENATLRFFSQKNGQSTFFHLSEELRPLKTNSFFITTRNLPEC